jgi:hypothetical protein
MITVGGREILIGGFHDHWARTNADNPTLLMAALNYYHYDFMCLMDGQGETPTKLALEAYCPGLRVYVGIEECAEWGHVVTVHARQRVIVPQGTPPRRVFEVFEEVNEFVAMAHPAPEARADKPLTYEEVGALMDEGVIKVTQLCPSPVANAWFRGRDAAGKLTPIVSGWDVHLVVPRKGLPEVLYGPACSPDGHLDSCDGHRTLVFTGENTLEAITAAVRRGESVIDNVQTGELIGPARLVRFLEENGYRALMARHDARRDECRLTLDEPAVAGGPATLRFSTPGTVRMPGTLQTPRELATGADGVLRTGPLPALLDRDLTYLPVVKTEPDGHVRVWAVALHHPVQLDVLPRIRGGRPEIELRESIPFHGTYRLQVDGAGDVAGDDRQLTVPFPGGTMPENPVGCRLQARSSSGVTRTAETLLTYVCAPKLEAGWEAIPGITVAESCAPPIKGQFGANRPYPGRDVFSGYAQFAWTVEAFVARVTVTDAVHHQPMRGHFMYYGDSLQLALDPRLKREDGLGSFYVYNYCQGPAGPEVFRWQRPDDDAASGYRALPGNVSIGGDYLTTEPWARGLIYTLRLPWAALAPVRPEPGLRMGLYLIMFNNDGQGLVDTLHWPRPIEGMWLVPRRWGVVTLT